MSTEEPKQEVVERVDVRPLSVVEASERASFDIQVATAKQYPMHDSTKLSKVKADMLSFATLDEETAEGCFYVLPRGN